MYLDDEGLAMFTDGVIAEFDGVMRKAARAYGVNVGHIANARDGKGSPMLRRIWGIHKHPQRSRLIFNAPAEMVYEFHAAAQAKGMTPVQYQRHLLDLDAGIGELP